MYRIYKKEIDGIEMLPLVEETPLGDNDIILHLNPGTKDYLAYVLYQAIQKRENYYQVNTPPAFGDPDFAKYCGVVAGILIASGMEESLEMAPEGELIVIKKGKRRFLVIDKVKRSRFFNEAVKENNKFLRDIGF